MTKKALFLDRDGVINRQIIGGYVTKISEFEFLPGVLDALSILAKKYDYIFIITNQQGIGKGVFSEDDLADIHSFMLQKVVENGGRIDKIYHCSALEKENSEFRKPNPGMGKQALKEFPDIDLKLSVMVGDSLSDMQFGKNLGVKNIFITHGKRVNNEIELNVDEKYIELTDFAKSV